LYPFVGVEDEQVDASGNRAYIDIDLVLAFSKSGLRLQQLPLAASQINKCNTPVMASGSVKLTVAVLWRDWDIP
jgi:hypothetical protein